MVVAVQLAGIDYPLNGDVFGRKMLRDRIILYSTTLLFIGRISEGFLTSLDVFWIFDQYIGLCRYV